MNKQITNKAMITTAIVFDHRGRTKMNEQGPLEVRVTYKRKPYYINTGIRVYRNEWKAGCICNRPDCVELNERLLFVTKRVEQEINLCLNEGRAINVTEIRERVWSAADTSSTSFLDWVEEQIPLLNMREKTRVHYYTLLRRLMEFNKLRTWNDLTIENLYTWDGWLHNLKKPQSHGEQQSGMEAECISDAAVFNYHKRLKALLARAERFGKIDRNPYSRLKGEFSRGEKENIEYLTETEMKAFESLRPVPGTMMASARDLFVFQMYTGLSYSDTQVFDMSKYKQIGDKWQYIGERVKTGVPFVNQLLPPAVDVLSRYGWKAPIIGNADYNKCLKMLGMAAGISTSLHSHLARHTFATFMLANGVKIENLSRMLGHTNITQTQRYAKVLAISVQRDFDMIADKIKGMKSNE